MQIVLKSTSSVYFFFSSRRRHTISKRDWSSDVCSSDLIDVDIAAVFEEIVDEGADEKSAPPRLGRFADENRSEERRVGEGGRAGWLGALWEQDGWWADGGVAV